MHPNPPTLLQVFLSKKLMDRMQCVNLSAMAKHFDQEKLPTAYGGDNKQALRQWLAQQRIVRKASEGSFASLTSGVTAM